MKKNLKDLPRKGLIASFDDVQFEDTVTCAMPTSPEIWQLQVDEINKRRSELDCHVMFVTGMMGEDGKSVDAVLIMFHR